MLSKLFCFLLPIGLAFGSPINKLAKRYVYATWSPGDLDIKASGEPFVGLDSGIGFYFQTDGNFVVYEGTPAVSDNLWNSATPGHNCQNNNCDLIFQGDGNLVIYVNGAAVWSTGTVGQGQSLWFYNSAPYVVVRGAGEGIIWTSSPLPPVGSPVGGPPPTPDPGDPPGGPPCDPGDQSC